MRILILGATGGTGRELVRQALDLGLLVTAFGRRIDRLPANAPALRVVQGNVEDYSIVESSMEGQEAVVSALGVGRTLHSDPAVVDGIRNTLRAMHVHGVRRLIYLSFIGVRESRAAAGFLIRYVARHPLRKEIADHEAKEQLIRASDAEWTIVRAPKLKDGAATARYRHGEAIAARSPFPRLPRADVAEFMLRQLTDATYLRRAPRVLP